MADYSILMEKFPFLTLFEYAEEEFLGIIQNKGRNMTGFFILELLKTEEEKRKFIELAESWWWGSNKKIPIDIFLKSDFDPFLYTLTFYSTKDVRIIQGHEISLQNINEKRVKRRKIELVRKDKP